MCVCGRERGAVHKSFWGWRDGGLIPQAFTTDRALNTGSQMQPRLNPLKTTIIHPPLHTPAQTHTYTHTRPQHHIHCLALASSSSPATVNQHLLPNLTPPPIHIHIHIHTPLFFPYHYQHPNFYHNQLLSVSGEYLSPFSTFST